MMIQAKLAALKGIAPHEWAVRFLFGGAVCVVAGLIARRFGPGVGGLFLAFPAIFPAGASMLEAHEKKHKARAGFDGTNRGRTVAGVDAAGAMLGSSASPASPLLAGFALPRLLTAATFALAILVWITLSVTLWLLAKSRTFRPMRGAKPSSTLFAIRNSAGLSLFCFGARSLRSASSVHRPKA